MYDHLRSVVRLVGLWAALMLVVGVVFAWGGLGAFLLGLFVVPIIGLVFAGFSVAMVLRGFDSAKHQEDCRADRVIKSLLAPALIVVTVVATLPLVWAGSWLGALSWLAAAQWHYRQIIAFERGHARDLPSQGYHHFGGIDYQVDRGPPLRIAFEPDGMLDNWSGIIYDPTGRVMEARGFDSQGQFYAAPEITKLFGGDLVGCKPLFGDFYSCSFT